MLNCECTSCSLPLTREEIYYLPAWDGFEYCYVCSMVENTQLQLMKGRAA